MKKIIIGVLLVGGILGCNYYEHHYTRDNCEVVRIENNIVTVEDKCGFYWQFEDEGYSKGDIVDLKMFDSCTNSNIKDDEIIKVIRKGK